MEDRRPLITLGLNRRYSPMVRRPARRRSTARSTRSSTCHQPFLPADHWTPRPDRRRRPPDQRGRALHRPLQPAHRQGRRSRSPPGRSEMRRTTCARSATSRVTLHYEGAVAQHRLRRERRAAVPDANASPCSPGARSRRSTTSAKLTVHGQQGPRSRAAACGSRWATRRQLQQFVRATPGRAQPPAHLGGRLARDHLHVRRAGEHPDWARRSTSPRSAVRCWRSPSPRTNRRSRSLRRPARPATTRDRRPELSANITTHDGAGQPDTAGDGRPQRSRVRVWVRRILFVALVGFAVWALVANRTG